MRHETKEHKKRHQGKFNELISTINNMIEAVTTMQQTLNRHMGLREEPKRKIRLHILPEMIERSHMRRIGNIRI